MARPPRTVGSRRFPIFACAAAGLIGAFGFVGVSVAASIAALDGPAQVGAGAAAVRFDPPPPVPLPSAHQVTLNAMLVAINEIRVAAGLSTYEWNDLMTVAAQQHSDDMAANRTMSHTGSDGSNVGDRLERVGFAASAWAENVAAGFVDPVAVVRAWMTSSGHRRHLLGDFRFVGVGVATSDDDIQYWTLDFAK
jgi:uncharacterized protein YkwD